MGLKHICHSTGHLVYKTLNEGVYMERCISQSQRWAFTSVSARGTTPFTSLFLNENVHVK